MKGLILKDLYNLAGNVRYMLFAMIIIAIGIIPTSDGVGFPIIYAIMLSIITISTFTFDDTSKWTGYALTMPVSRNELVKSKFIVLAFFCIIGCISGIVTDIVGGAIMKRFDSYAENIGVTFLLALAALGISLIFGSTLIPVVIKFGAEKARILMAVVIIVPAAIIWGGITLALSINRDTELINFVEENIFVLLCGLFVFALLWSYVMYRISCHILKNKEF